jgi:hypothetical protein
MVGQSLLPKLVAQASKKCKKVNEEPRQRNNVYEAYFYAFLPKFIKSWGEIVTFIDGAKSVFYTSFEDLKKENIDFEVQVAQKPREIKVTELVPLVQHLLEFAKELDPSVWTQDKEMAGFVYSQLKSLQKKVNAALEQSEQNPDMDLTMLLEMSTKLTNLKELITKALKGDMNAVVQIAQGNDSKEKSSNAPQNEAANPPIPQDQPDYINNKIEELQEENTQLETGNFTLWTRVMVLEAVLNGKPLPLINGPKNYKLDFALAAGQVTLAPQCNGALSKEEEKVKPVQKREVEAPKLYRDCILISSGCLYEDENVKIEMVRSMEQKQKIATVKLNFFNKSKNKTLEIQQFVPVQYNKSGN